MKKKLFKFRWGLGFLALWMGFPVWALESSARFEEPVPIDLPSLSNGAQPIDVLPDLGNSPKDISFPSEIFYRQERLLSSQASLARPNHPADRDDSLDLTPFKRVVENPNENLKKFRFQEKIASGLNQELAHNSVSGGVFFDGTQETEGPWKYDSEGALWFSGKQAQLIGSGSYGRVFVHPANQDWVVKVIHGSRIYGANSFYEHPEFSNLEKLSQAHLSPRPIDTGLIKGIPYIISERVHGETLGDTIGDKKFGIRKLKLLRQMVNSLLSSRFSIVDLTPSNVMLGHTASNPEPQAYIIDAGLLTSISVFSNPFIDIQDLVKDCNDLLIRSGSSWKIEFLRREADHKAALFFSR